MLFSTSDNYSKDQIIENYGLVDSTVVIGANIFRDVFASFRDILGGETKGYKKDLSNLKLAVQREITAKAKKFGANAVIALKVDMDEISGGGKSMFMYQMVGTAVKLDIKMDHISEELSEEIDFDTLKELSKRVEAVEDISNNGGNYSKLRAVERNNWWDEQLYEIYIDDLFSEQSNNTEQQYFELISNIPNEFYAKRFFENLSHLGGNKFSIIGNALVQSNWFDPDMLVEQLVDDDHVRRFRALVILNQERKKYSVADIEGYERIKLILSEKFDDSVDIIEKEKMFGGNEFYKCPYCLKERELKKKGFCSACNASYFGFTNKMVELEKILRGVETIIKTLKFLENRVQNNRSY